jgi:hypothetical protein
MHRKLILAITAAAFLGLSACDRGGGGQPTAGTPAGNAAIVPAALFLAAEPQGVKTVAEVKTAAKQGDKIVLRGKIGGGEEPFIAARAVFTIVDPGVKSCKDMGEDHCATPWDYCCETPESLVANSATIQVVGTDGRPLKAGLKGLRGLSPLAEVYVVGTVSQRDDAGTFVVNADGIWIRPQG